MKQHSINVNKIYIGELMIFNNRQLNNINDMPGR